MTILKNNYGAMLQAYGTYSCFIKKNIIIDFISYVPLDEYDEDNYKAKKLTLKSILLYLYFNLNPKLIKRRIRFNNFLKSMNVQGFFHDENQINNIIKNYDALGVGSDQVWYMEKKVNSNIFFLPFKHKFKFSFSSSFGSDFFVRENDSYISKSLKEFKFVTVREKSGVDYLKNIGINSSLLLDPTLLIQNSEWNELAGDKPIIKGDYVLIYGVDNSDLSNKAINFIKKENIKIICVSNSIIFSGKVDKFFKEAGPKEFLNIIKFSSFVYTSSFHGLCFSIVFNKSFIINEHKKRNTRIDNLLSILNIKNRLINNFVDFKNIYYEKVDYRLVNHKLQLERVESNKIIDSIIDSL